MNMKSTFSSRCHGLRFRSMALGILSALALMCGQVAHAETTFVYLKTGNVHVFPDSCVMSVNSGSGYFTVTARDGQVYTYISSTISYLGHSPSLPASV